jgi:hypothetical protein
MDCTDLILALANSIGLDFDEEEFGPHDLLVGILVETEHGPVDPETDVTEGSLEAAAKIAWAHLNEHPDYYEKLSEMEEELEEKTAEGRLEKLLRGVERAARRAQRAYQEQGLQSMSGARWEERMHMRMDQAYDAGATEDQIDEILERVGPLGTEDVYESTYPSLASVTQRQLARDAKDRVKELNLGEVAIGLAQDEEGSWTVAIRAQRSLTPDERTRITKAAGDVGVEFEEVAVEPRGAAFIRRGDYIYKRGKSARGYLLEEMSALHDAAKSRWKAGREQLMRLDYEGFLDNLHQARDWADDQFEHLIEITEEAMR